MGPLPSPPQAPPQAIPGPRPDMMYPPQGLMPYKVPVDAQLINGINGFVTSFLGAKQQRQEHYDQLFESGMKKLMLGLPVDKDQLAKYGQKSAMYKDLQWTQHESPQEQQYQAQQEASQQPAPGMVGGIPPPQGPPPQPPPQQNPTLMNRVQQGMGFGFPQPQQGSPGLNFLSQLGQAGQAGAGGLVGKLAQGNKLEDMSAQEHMQLLGLGKTAISGDPKSSEQAREILSGWMRSQKGEALPGEDIRRAMRFAHQDWPEGKVDEAVGNAMLYGYLGKGQMMMKMAELTKDLLPRAGGNPQVAQQAAMQIMSGAPVTAPLAVTAEDQQKINEGVGTYLKNYPFAEAGTARILAMADYSPAMKSVSDMILSPKSMMDQKDSKGKVIGQVNKYLGPRDGTAAANEWQSKLGVEKDLGFARVGIEQQNVNLATWNGMQKELGDEADTYKPFINDPSKYGTDQYNKAMESIANVVSTKNTIPIQYRGKTYNVPPPAQVTGAAIGQKGSALSAWHQQNVLKSGLGADPHDVNQYVKAVKDLSDQPPEVKQAIKQHTPTAGWDKIEGLLEMLKPKSMRQVGPQQQ